MRRRRWGAVGALAGALCVLGPGPDAARGAEAPSRPHAEALVRIGVAPVPEAGGLAERLAAELERHLGRARFLEGRVRVRVLPGPVDPAALSGVPSAEVVAPLAAQADLVVTGTVDPDGSLRPVLVHLYAMDPGYQSRQAAGRAPVVPPGHALPRFTRDDPLSTLYAVQGVLYVQQGRYAAAAQVLSALDAFPDLRPEARYPVVFYLALAELMRGIEEDDGARVDAALYHFGALVAAPGAAANPAVLGATLFNRGLAYQRHPVLRGAAQLDLAVASFEAALPYFPTARVPALHARLLHQLASAEERYPPDPDGRHLHRAIAAYGRALSVWNARAHPEAYRAALHNSAACYQRLPTGDRRTNLRRAIALYNRALKVPGLAARPDLAAATFGNLGQAWQSLPPDPDGNTLWRALAAYDQALRYWTPARNPGQHRRLHQLAGQAFQAMPAGDRRENLTRALGHFDRALAVTPREEEPVAWALIQFKRGVVLADLPPPGERRSLAKGREAFRAALDVLTPDKFPNLHAKVVQNLGRVEARLAAVDGGP